MKPVSTALSGVLASSQDFIRANLYNIQFAGQLAGLTASYTDGETDITINGTTYQSNQGVVKRSRSRQTEGFEIDDCDVELMVQPLQNSFSVPVNAIIGSLDGATLQIFKCYATGSYSEFSVLGTVIDINGFCTPTNASNTKVQISVRSLADQFVEPLPKRLIQPGCPYALYQPFTCNLNADLWKEGGQVAYAAIGPATGLQYIYTNRNLS